MAEGGLLLGPILFQDFELPERVRWGGAQKLVVHRLPGGVRVIDQFGRDDADIVWSGMFTGDDATLRARSLDLMRTQGGTWPLTWDQFFYTVMIARFDAEFDRPNWIPYRIACKVLRDEVEAMATTVVTLADGVLSDLAAADGYGSGVALGPAIGSLNVPEAAQPGSAAHAIARATLLSASDGVDFSIGTTENAIAAASWSDAGGLGATVVQAGQLAALTGARGYVRRAAANLDNAEG